MIAKMCLEIARIGFIAMIRERLLQGWVASGERNGEN